MLATNVCCLHKRVHTVFCDSPRSHYLSIKQTRLPLFAEALGGNKIPQDLVLVACLLCLAFSHVMFLVDCNIL